METPAKQIDTLQENVQEKVVSKKERNIRFSLLQTYVSVIVILFITLAILARFIPYFSLDLTITRAIQSINANWFYIFMNAISWIGFMPQMAIIICGIFLLVFVSGLRWEAIMLAINALSVSLVSILLKLVIHRARPTADIVHVFRHLQEYSFPSGHVLIYTSFFGFLFFLIYSLMKKSFVRDTALIILGVVILLIAPSRIYLGAHWASDVLGAYMFGSLWLLLIIKIYRMGKKRTVISQVTAE